MQTLHHRILEIKPDCTLWFLDGKNVEGKTVANTYGKNIGKASVTGYCIKFKMLKAINIDVLEAAIRDGFEAQS